MRHAPVHIIDTAEVPPDRAAAMIRLLHGQIVPVMQEAGAELISMLMSSTEIGEPVLFQIIWGIADHEAWNIMRKTLFLDPRWSCMSAEAKALRTTGTRRFLYPVEAQA